MDSKWVLLRNDFADETRIIFRQLRDKDKAILKEFSLREEEIPDLYLAIEEFYGNI